MSDLLASMAASVSEAPHHPQRPWLPAPGGAWSAAPGLSRLLSAWNARSHTVAWTRASQAAFELPDDQCEAILQALALRSEEDLRWTAMGQALASGHGSHIEAAARVFQFDLSEPFFLLSCALQGSAAGVRALADRSRRVEAGSESVFSCASPLGLHERLRSSCLDAHGDYWRYRRRLHEPVIAEALLHPRLHTELSEPARLRAMSAMAMNLQWADREAHDRAYFDRWKTAEASSKALMTLWSAQPLELSAQAHVAACLLLELRLGLHRRADSLWDQPSPASSSQTLGPFDELEELAERIDWAAAERIARQHGRTLAMAPIFWAQRMSEAARPQHAALIERVAFEGLKEFESMCGVSAINHPSILLSVETHGPLPLSFRSAGGRALERLASQKEEADPSAFLPSEGAALAFECFAARASKASAERAGDALGHFTSEMMGLFRLCGPQESASLANQLCNEWGSAEFSDDADRNRQLLDAWSEKLSFAAESIAASRPSSSAGGRRRVKV